LPVKWWSDKLIYLALQRLPAEPEAGSSQLFYNLTAVKALAIAALILGATFLGACDSSTDPADIPEAMKATVNGTAWTATSVTLLTQAGQTILSGQAADTSSLSFQLGAETSAGDYELGDLKPV
jgi:hypothetical protein